MGLSHIDAARLAAKLTPTISAPAKTEKGHGRSRQREVLHTVAGQHPELRGVPLVGTGPGGLENTRPGGELGAVQRLADEARELNEHAREIARQKMMEARERLRNKGVKPL